MESAQKYRTSTIKNLQIKQETKDKQNLLRREKEIFDEDIKALLEYTHLINHSNIDDLLEYIINATIKSLLQKLFDQSLILNHKYIIQAIDTIAYGIGDGIAPYLDIIIPCFSYYLRKNDNQLNFDILKLFEKLLKLCGSDFGTKTSKNIDLLLQVVLKGLAFGECKMKCLDTLIELIESSKIYTSLIRR